MRKRPVSLSAKNIKYIMDPWNTVFPLMQRGNLVDWDSVFMFGY